MRNKLVLAAVISMTIPVLAAADATACFPCHTARKDNGCISSSFGK